MKSTIKKVFDLVDCTIQWGVGGGGGGGVRLVLYTLVLGNAGLTLGLAFILQRLPPFASSCLLLKSDGSLRMRFCHWHFAYVFFSTFIGRFIYSLVDTKNATDIRPSSIKPIIAGNIISKVQWPLRNTLSLSWCQCNHSLCTDVTFFLFFQRIFAISPVAVSYESTTTCQGPLSNNGSQF